MKLQKYIVIICVVFVFILWGIFFSQNYCIITMEALGVLFAGLGFIALIGTITMQQKATQEAENRFQQQSFETTFFNMLKLYNELINSIIYKESKESKGKEALRSIAKKMNECMKVNIDEIVQNDVKRTIPTNKNHKEHIKNFYNEFWSTHEPFLSHYFSFIYYIVSFVDKSESLNDKSKEYYMNIFREQLSSSELELIFYNGFNYKNFKSLIEKYALLKHISYYGNPHVLADRNLYEDEAFGENVLDSQEKLLKAIEEAKRSKIDDPYCYIF